MYYSLAKKLKDAGFTQGYERFIDSKGNTFTVEEWDGDGMIFFPTLEELIDACGEGKGQLLGLRESFAEGGGTHWWATLTDTKLKEHILGEECGKIPSEAVANLWLKLNEK